MNTNKQLLTFAGVGAIGTAFHYALLVCVVSGFGLDPYVGAMVGATGGALSNYWLNHRFTFCSDRAHKEALPRFLLMAGIGILLNGIIVKTLTLVEIHYLISQMVATLTIFVLNFLVSKLWIFRKVR